MSRAMFKYFSCLVSGPPFAVNSSPQVRLKDMRWCLVKFTNPHRSTTEMTRNPSVSILNCSGERQYGHAYERTQPPEWVNRLQVNS